MVTVAAQGQDEKSDIQVMPQSLKECEHLNPQNQYPFQDLKLLVLTQHNVTHHEEFKHYKTLEKCDSIT